MVRLHVRTLASQLGDLSEVMAEGRDDRDGDVPYRVVIGVFEKAEGDAGHVEGVVPERDLRKDVAYTGYLASLRIGDRVDDRGAIAVALEKFHDPVDAFQHAGEAFLMRLDHLAVEGLGCHEGLAARRLQLVCLHARVFAGKGREVSSDPEAVASVVSLTTAAGLNELLNLIHMGQRSSRDRTSASRGRSFSRRIANIILTVSNIVRPI